MTDEPINNTLKPCPFCKGKAEAIEEMNISAFAYYLEENSVYCVDCGGSTKGFRTEDEAVTAWNTRV